VTEISALVTGIGWATAAGTGRGRAAGAAFSMEAGALPPLARKDVFDAPNPRFGRMSGYSKQGIAAIAFALRDAGLDRFDAKRPIGIFAGSQLGSLATDLDYFDTVLPESGGLASPALFAYTLANCLLGEAAIQFGLTGPGVVVTEGPGGDGLHALRMALEELASGPAGAVLAGCCDFPALPPLPGIEAPLPGALFLVLEPVSARDAAAYPTVSLRADDAVLCGGIAAASLAALAHACLPHVHHPPGSRP
jgi:3-oxoacyl-[acyl-carrier-protein] synthase II